MQVRLLEYRRVLHVREYSRVLLADMNDVLFQERLPSSRISYS